jgi:adenylate cyclase
MTLHFRSDRSREMWSVVRNKIRAPLHKLISYAELVSEDDACRGNSAVLNEITSLLHICETILHQTQAAFERAMVEETDAQTAVAEAVLQHNPNLQRIRQELEQLCTNELSKALRRDIGAMSQTIYSFEGALATLAIPPLKELPTQPVSALKPQSSSLQPVRDQLIAQVEYRGLLLVVDDDEGNRDVLSRRLLRDGYEVMLAESGRQALRMLDRYDFDLVLLDIMMQGMDGISVLAELKRSPKLNQLPVIMITAVDEIESIAHCIEAGADDYLLKPFNPVLLRARINALLERKRLQDEKVRQHREMEAILEDSRRQKERGEQMLLNILPAIVAEELREFGSVKPMYFEDVTIVFADIVGFTLSTEQLPADELVEILNEYFTRCDKIVMRYGLEKLKTIGDCYMFAGGLPVRNPSHPVDSVLAATEMIGAIKDLSAEGKVNWQLRIGINTGPVIAGVVGIRKFAFDVWGDSVNFSSRVEACGAPGRINLSVSTFARVKDFFACERREPMRVKEGKEVEMYFVNGIAPGLSDKQNMSPLTAFQTRYATYFRKEMQTFPASIFERESVIAPKI